MPPGCGVSHHYCTTHGKRASEPCLAGVKIAQGQGAQGMDAPRATIAYAHLQIFATQFDASAIAALAATSRSVRNLIADECGMGEYTERSQRAFRTLRRACASCGTTASIFPLSLPHWRAENLLLCAACLPRRLISRSAARQQMAMLPSGFRLRHVIVQREVCGMTTVRLEGDDSRAYVWRSEMKRVYTKLSLA